MKEQNIKISVTKENPKENATTYTIQNVSDIVNALTSKNVESFLSDFSTLLRMVITERELVELCSQSKEPIKNIITEFTWIDD